MTQSSCSARCVKEPQFTGTTPFSCSYSEDVRIFRHSWEDTVGSGHAPLALRADWQGQLLRCHRELGFQRVRFHDLLSDDMGTLICQNKHLLYSFFNVDQIFDYLLSIGMRPFVELSFMPRALASAGDIVFHYNANVTPPKDNADWATLIQKIATHWIDRYGVNEVRNWRFEVWNEPNLKAFWTGSKQDYFKFYQCTAETLKKVDASLVVGGPVTAKNAWISDFLAFCKKHSVPVDFISTHHYPTDAFGRVGADTTTQLEHAPRGLMRKQASQARSEAGSLPLYYTEWNISSNPRDSMHDEPFAAAFATKIMMEAQDIVQGYSYWTFSDIFEENYFPSIPFQGGFGLLNIHGIPKPIYRAFELLHQLGTEAVPVEGSHDTVDAWVIRKSASVTVLLTNLAMPRKPIQTALIAFSIRDAPAPRLAYVQRIDEDHANPRHLWESMGSPQYLSARQVSQLETASCLIRQLIPCDYKGGTIALSVSLPPQSVAAVTIELA